MIGSDDIFIASVLLPDIDARINWIVSAR
jgi:hypothetical protein